MKTKLYTDLYTTEEFLEYWKTAGRRELRYRLKSLKHGLTTSQKNEKDAITFLLA